MTRLDLARQHIDRAEDQNRNGHLIAAAASAQLAVGNALIAAAEALAALTAAPDPEPAPDPRWLTDTTR